MLGWASNALKLPIFKVDALTVKFKKIVISIISIQILAACTIPGSVLKVKDKHVVKQADADVSIDELVDVYPITPPIDSAHAKAYSVGGRQSKFATVYARLSVPSPSR